MRAELAAAGIKGKRLTYRQPHKQGQIDVRLGRVLINARAMSAFGVIADVAWASRNVR